MRWLGVLAVVVGCTSTDSNDVVGPYTGPVRRYVVDGFTLPHNGSDARATADDLDGDGVVDNRLGTTIGVLDENGYTTTHAADMIAAGVVSSSVEIVADDLMTDPTVAVTYLGTDQDNSTLAGGAFVAGSFASNRTYTTHVPGRATLRLPVLADADPAELELDGMEVDLVPDGRSLGGLDATIRGGVAHTTLEAATVAGIGQMLATNPGDYSSLAKILDFDGDGVITRDEIATNALIYQLEAPDIRLFVDGKFSPRPAPYSGDSVSIGFRAHLIPCETGRCSTSSSVESCHDRVLDQDETDVDCGGSHCRPCAAGFACKSVSDCSTTGCNAGLCNEASCSDGRRDGFETDVDCGGLCAKCRVGQRCASGGDCPGRCDPITNRCS
ncbi:MAG: hypothetical protein JWO36_2375 [Myxococcales bacterium]|nr:hypothetical protein [Myxococcales bacterium]